MLRICTVEDGIAQKYTPAAYLKGVICLKRYTKVFGNISLGSEIIAINILPLIC